MTSDAVAATCVWVTHSLYRLFPDLKELQVTENNQEKQDDDQDGPTSLKTLHSEEGVSEGSGISSQIGGTEFRSWVSPPSREAEEVGN